MSPAILFAATLTVLSSAAAVYRRRQSPPLNALVVASMALIMLAVLFVPSFHGAEAAGLVLALMIPMLGGAFWSRRRGNHRCDMVRSIFAMTILDIGFMAINMLLMPTMGGGADPQDSSSQSMQDMNNMVNLLSSASVMRVLPLLGWAWCIGIIAMQLALRRGPCTAFHAACSFGMLAAMAIMIL